jgi:hypothetical protein
MCCCRLGRCADDAGAFGHVQLWSIFSPTGPAAVSVVVWDQVRAAYLLVPVMFAYEVTLYFIMKEYLHWWCVLVPLNPQE